MLALPDALPSKPALGQAGKMAWPVRLAVELAPHDWLVLVYLLVLNVVVFSADPSPTRSTSQLRVGLLLVWLVLGFLLYRARDAAHPGVARTLYRLAIYGPVQVSYFLFRDILPIVNSGSLDQELHALDMRYFGVEPALFLDRFVGPGTTEWFAFFYFGYFVVLLLHVVLLLFFSKDQRLLGEFGLGTLIVFCIGHSVYMLVPGFGPYRVMAGHFQNALPHGLWMDVVKGAVESGGAIKDIFPSLHTAAPTFITLFAFRQRQRIPFRYTWPLLFCFSVNIIGATLFLRWHYLVDVLAGMFLAGSAVVIAHRVTDFELSRRARLALRPLWL